MIPYFTPEFQKQFKKRFKKYKPLTEQEYYLWIRSSLILQSEYKFSSETLMEQCKKEIKEVMHKKKTKELQLRWAWPSGYSVVIKLKKGDVLWVEKKKI